MVRPRKGSPSVWPYLTAPSLALMPYSVTIARATAVDRLLEEVVGDGPLVVPGGQQGRLVDDVGEVRAGEAGRAPGDRVQVDVRRERLALRVYPQDRLAPLHVRPVDGDLPVEPPGA